MDNEAVTAKSLLHTYMINDGTFAKNYKEVINDFSSWEQREYASKQVLLPENMGEYLGIGETSFCHEVYTILHNKDGRGKKHTIITIVKETKPSNVITVLRQLPEENRLKVSDNNGLVEQYGSHSKGSGQSSYACQRGNQGRMTYKMQEADA